MLTASTQLIAVAGVFGIGLIIGLVVLMTAEEPLMAVARTAARDVSGSFWVGLLWQLLAVPLLAVIVVACAITIIGILAIPLAALAWALAYAGAFTLGILAVAMVIGRALVGRGEAEPAPATRHLSPALWLHGLPTALRDGRLAAWRAQGQQGFDAVAAPGDPGPIPGALADAAAFALRALRTGRSLTAAMTADIEWNGPPVGSPD